MNSKKSTITLTFGDMAENHVGMEKLGSMVDKGQGFQVAELEKIQKDLAKKGIKSELHRLNSKPEHAEAAILVVKNFVDYLLKDEGLNKEHMFQEQAALDVDKKAFMKGRVVNKHARWNLCFDDKARAPNYEGKMGRIVAFD